MSLGESARCVVLCVEVEANGCGGVRRANLGYGRVVPKHHEPFYVHRSVKLRMETPDIEGGPYKPKAQYANEPIWVD